MIIDDRFFSEYKTDYPFLDYPEVRRAKTAQYHLFDVTARKMKSIQFI